MIYVYSEHQLVQLKCTNTFERFQIHTTHKGLSFLLAPLNLNITRHRGARLQLSTLKHLELFLIICPEPSEVKQ
jgi:hypothetical protein